MEWIIPSHFTSWVNQTNHIRHQKYRGNIGLGNLYHWSMRPNGTPSILIIKLTPLGWKFQLNSPQDLHLSEITSRKKLIPQSLFLSRRHLLSLSFQPKPKAKSIGFSNISSQPATSPTWKNPPNYMPRHWDSHLAHLMYWRLKNPSWP